MAAIQSNFRGFANVFLTYRTRLLSRPTLIVIVLAMALTAGVFAISLFIRYGRAMAHDFREILGRQFPRRPVTVLAFAFLFLPLFVWLGPIWLAFYWFIIFFGYADAIERVMIVLVSLLIAVLPVALDQSANWTAGVDSPIVMSAIASAEHSYQPEALRRMQELVGVIPITPICSSSSATSNCRTATNRRPARLPPLRRVAGLSRRAREHRQSALPRQRFLGRDHRV